MVLTNRFKDVPIDEDTNILLEREIEINGIKALYQFWAWDEFEGESLIFLASNLEQIDDYFLAKFIPKPKRKNVTIVKKNTKYTFVNYNVFPRNV